MTSSGIKANQDSIKLFHDMKEGKMYKLIIFEISEDCKTICPSPECESKLTCNHDEFINVIKDKFLKKCCYIIYEIELRPKVTKLLFITWTTDCAKVKDRMIYASSKEALKQEFYGLTAYCDANEISDLDFCELVEKCKKH